MLSDSFIKDNVKFVFVDEKNIQFFGKDYITNSNCLIEVRIKKEVLDYFLSSIVSFRNGNNLEEQDITDREVEVLKHLSEGLNNREISDLMHVSVHTTKAHLHSIFTKLAVQGRTEAVVKAIKNHLIIL